MANDNEQCEVKDYSQEGDAVGIFGDGRIVYFHLEHDGCYK